MNQLSGRRFADARFWPLLVLLLAFTAAHCVYGTHRDGFTIDEPYHVAAGASYLRFHDYRVNPEHPPLVKLVAGLAEPASVLKLQPLSILNDKRAERKYTQQAVFHDSDPVRVQRRARVALILFNLLLLLGVGVLLREVFGASVALFALLLLGLDPTVCAHLPVVMTDLPMALLGTEATLLAILAMQRRRWREWLLFGVVVGLLLATKHSAPLIVLPLAAGCAVALLWQAFVGRRRATLREVPRLLVALLVGVAVLWSAYGFRYHESRQWDAKGQYVETFNRPLETKITDLRSPFLRRALTVGTRAHVAPRAYIWGLADTLRAGVESRPGYVQAFGRDFYDKAPAWVAFAFLLVKLPLGFLALVLAAAVLLGMRRMPQRWMRPALVVLGVLVAFMAFIARNGVFYAGLRHWLFSVPLLAILAALAAVELLRDRRWWVRALPLVAVIWIAIAMVPERRLWEYHNAFAGGTANAWRGFSNESVDLGQRSKEIASFYNQRIRPERPEIWYPMLQQDQEHAGIEILHPTPEQVGDGHISGWFVLGMPGITGDNWKGGEPFRTAQPVARLGNAFVYHGSFFLPRPSSGILTWEGVRQLTIPEGDHALAEKLLLRAAFFNDEAVIQWVLLGNLSLERHNPQEALERYRTALRHEKRSALVAGLIKEQIAKVEADPAHAKPMRDPDDE